MLSTVVDIRDVEIVQVTPVIDPRVRGYCKLPYLGHPQGCPNFNKRDICPPKAPLFDKLIDINKPVYCIVNKFDLKAHAQIMRNRHPDWSERQIYCCLYWQGRARKQLREKVNKFLQNHPGYLALYCPEGSGVDLVATVKQFGLEFEWPARKYAYQVAMAGYALVL